MGKLLCHKPEQWSLQNQPFPCLVHCWMNIAGSTLIVQPSQQVTHFGMDSLNFWALTEGFSWYPASSVSQIPRLVYLKVVTNSCPTKRLYGHPQWLATAPITDPCGCGIRLWMWNKKGIRPLPSEQRHRRSLQWIPLVLDSVITVSSFQLRIFHDSWVAGSCSAGHWLEDCSARIWEVPQAHLAKTECQGSLPDYTFSSCLGIRYVHVSAGERD